MRAMNAHMMQLLIQDMKPIVASFRVVLCNVWAQENLREALSCCLTWISRKINESGEGFFHWLSSLFPALELSLFDSGTL